MERLLVVWCPELAGEEEDGRDARAFARACRAVSDFSPVVEAVRPGVCSLGARGPARYFGGELRLALRIATAVSEVEGAVPGENLGTVQVGIADGLFAAVLAARAAATGPLVVPAGGTPAFLAPWPVDVLDQPELADLLHRLGIRTLGGFARIPTRHVLARFGTQGVACHAVARGVQGELAGIRAPLRIRPNGNGNSDTTGTGDTAGDTAGDTVRQPGFWGAAAAAEARAERAATRAVELLHPEAVVVGRLQGGRGPGERARLIPWAGRRLQTAGPGPEPWPGRIPSPSPVVVYDRPLPAVLLDTAQSVVGVSASGVLSAPPARLSVAGERWTAVTGWAGPWPADERWWSGRARRRKARMQLVVDTGAAYLLVRERGGWWVEGAYD